jgi:NAD-dependent dihydropyrimidine dehydrogenase PreA subunit
METPVVTICVCASRNIIDRDRAASLAALLAAAGRKVSLEPDMCEKVQNASPEALHAASGVVVACHTRAVGALFDTLGVRPSAMYDLRGGTVEGVLEEMGLGKTEPAAHAPDAAAVETFSRTLAAMPRREGADAWYPVIDKERCSECEKCHDFCLFGVYAIEHGRVVVRNPANCKNDCPACARLCPGGAIIFPKYAKSPVNGGPDLEEHAFTLDTGALYNEALRERLARRREGMPLLKRDTK